MPVSNKTPKIPRIEFDTSGIPDLSPEYFAYQDISARIKASDMGMTTLTPQEALLFGFESTTPLSYEALLNEAGGLDFNVMTPEGWKITSGGEYYAPTGALSTLEDFQYYYETVAQGEYITNLQKTSGLTQQQWRDELFGYLPENLKTEWATLSDYDLLSRSMGYIAENFLDESGNISAFAGISAQTLPPNITESLLKVMAGTSSDIGEIISALKSNPEEFMRGIVDAQGGELTPEKEAIIKYFIPDITDVELQSIFSGLSVDELSRRQTINDIFRNPEQNPMFQFNEWNMQRIGLGSEFMSNIMKANTPVFTDEAINEFWEIPATREAVIDWFKKYQGIEPGAQLDLYLGWKTGDKTLLQPSWWQKSFQVVLAGFGDVLNSAAGALSWMGLDTSEIDFGKMAQQTMPLDAEGIGWQILRALPFAASLIPFSIVGAVGGSAAAAAMGLGRIGTWIMGTVGAVALSRPAESLMEVGSSWSDLVAQYGVDVAHDKAMDIFKANMTLGSGWDIAEMLVALAPVPKGWSKILKTSKFIKTAQVGGKMVVVGLTSAGEEVWQQWVQNNAAGKVFAWDDEMKAVAIVGGLMGMGLGFGGDVISNIFDGTKTKASKEIQARLDQLVEEAKSQGLNDTVAQLQALQVVADESEDGMNALKNTLETIATELGQGKKNSLTEIDKGLKRIAELKSEKQMQNVIGLMKATGWKPLSYTDVDIEVFQAITGKKPTKSMLNKAGTKVRADIAIREFSKAFGFASQEDFVKAVNAVQQALMEEDGFNAAKRVIEDEQRTSEAQQMTGEEIAAKLGVRYDGLQEGIGMQFTDPVTRSTTYGNTLEETRANINNMRRKASVPEITMGSTKKIEDIVNNLNKAIREAKPARQQTEALKSKELARRAAVAASILQGGEGSEAFQKSMSALKGELPQADFDLDFDSVGLTEQDIQALYEKIRTSNLKYFQKLNTYEALATLLSGKIPTEGDLILLERMFGTELVKSIMSKWTTGKKISHALQTFFNIPRTLLTIADLSATLRQGILLSTGQPVQFGQAFVQELRVIFSEKNYRQVDGIVHNNVYAEKAEEHKLYLAPIGEAASVATREEGYMGANLLEKIPVIGSIVRASERAYNTFLNVLRMQTWSYWCRKWENTGKSWKDYDNLASFINHATGRGDLGALSGIGGWLNAAYFSPKWTISRVQVPLDLITSTPAVRGIVARNLVSFVASGIGILSLLAWFGFDVEKDPRSADFGKIKIGNTRIDFWGGYLPYVRLVVQVAMGERKKTATGEVIDVDRIEIAENFMRSKLAPIPGLIWDLASGQTFVGEELTAENAGTLIYEKLTPMFIQDIVDAVQDSGAQGAAFGIWSAFGIGIQTYSDNWNTLEDQLGMAVRMEDLPYTIEVHIYTTENYYSDILKMIGGATADMLAGKQGVPDKVVAVAEAHDILKTLGDIRNVSLINLNADETKGDTYVQFYYQWQQRLKLGDDAEALKEFDKLYPHAYYGNMTQNEFVLLQEYYALGAEDDKKAFLIEHPELTNNPRKQWLIDHPAENAKLAIWGKAEIYTLEAYNQANALVAQLDIPANAVAFNLPPANLVAVHFAYQSAVEHFGAHSNEARLILASNPEYAEWRDLDVPTTSQAALQISVQYAEDFDWYNTGIPQKYEYITNLKERNAAIAAERAEYLKANPEFRVERLRQEAYSLYNPNTYEKFPEGQIDNYVKYYELPVKGFRRERFLIDNPEFATAMNDIKGLSIPDALRIPNVEYDNLYDKWQSSFDYLDAIGDPLSAQYIADTKARSAARESQFIGDNGLITEFGKAYLAREAYGKLVPDNYVDNYVGYYSLIKQGRPAGWFTDYDGDPLTWYEDEWFLLEHKDFYENVYLNSAYWSTPHKPKDFSKVPTKYVFALYGAYNLLPPRSDARKDFLKQYPELKAWLDLF